MLQEIKGFEYLTISSGNRSWKFPRSKFTLISPSLYKNQIQDFPGLEYSFENHSIPNQHQNTSTLDKEETKKDESKKDLNYDSNLISDTQSQDLKINIPDTFSKESVDAIIHYIYHQVLDIKENTVAELFCLGKSFCFNDVVSKTSSYIILKSNPRQMANAIRICFLHHIDSETFERIIELKFNKYITSLDILPLPKLYSILQKNYKKVSSDEIAKLIALVSSHQNNESESSENDEDKIDVEPTTITEFFSLFCFLDFEKCSISILKELFLSLSKINNDLISDATQQGSLHMAKFVFDMIQKQIEMKEGAVQMMHSLEKCSKGIEGSADYQLSIEYERGLYVPQNQTQSEQYEHSAIENGDPEIVLEIADKHFYVHNDRETAFSLYQHLLCPDNKSNHISPEKKVLGISICGSHIASKMDDFLGPNHNAPDAIALLKLAIEQGNEDCCVYGFELSLKSPNSIDKDYVTKHLTKIFGKFIVDMKCQEIADDQFSNNAKLESVFIPPSVKRIGDNSFADCTNLKKIFITPNVEFIGSCAFLNCTSLSIIKLPSSIKEIGESAFSGCTSLKTIQFAHDCQIESIEFGCFGCCVNLETIQFPNNLKQICDEAFSRCHSLTSLSIPNSVWNIGEKAFSECKVLTNLSYDDSSCLHCIQNSAFSGCRSLKSLRLPPSLRSIGDHAFEECVNLINLHLSFGIEHIGSSAFYHCEALQEIDIPSSTKFIGDYAFYQCYSLRSLELPLRLKNFGLFAFYQCGQVEELSVASLDHLNLLFQNGNPKSLKKLKLLTGPIEIKKGQISEFENLQVIDIPSVIRKIGQDAFANCPNITKVIIQSKFTEVDANAFKNTPEIIYAN